ncbi:interferon-induced, double-stranded RNA-activated protein kinase isoform X2 [Archocentrus centrarchus]|uniref:interferon-induced, double-stranded RNA-activated protein kinase isoform X2 n=1 Tax=Archocentrus centrarchus TaxID=63155 RepID=UPI0011EA274D|nr:interferon-induced, double-stranded RNA-activated protein kinase isoform X2 [Archocentrus centrarchus]
MDNYVAKLNEYAQRQRLVLQFEEIGVAGPDHIKTFTLRAVLDGKAYPDGVGKNKKEARQNAAKNALAGLLEKPADIVRLLLHCIHSLYAGIFVLICCMFVGYKQTENAAEVSATSVHQTSASNINYICWLNEYGQKNRVLVRPVETTRPGLNNQWCNFIVGDKEYPAASGKTRREAKEEAAKLVYHEICGNKSSEANFRSADDGAKPFTPPRTPDSGHPKSISTAPSKSDSVVFVKSSNPPKEQAQSPDVKPKIRIAANFPNAHRNSKEDIMPNFKVKNTTSGQSRNTPAPSSRFTSEFDCIERLGKGAFGRVFKANQKLLQKYYAIKIIHRKEKALREVVTLSELHHSNIVRYYTCWLEDSEYQSDSTADSSTSHSSTDSAVKYLYIQMELCDSKTLRVWIDEKNIQNVKKSLRDSKRREEGLNIALQIVSGVEYIHSKKLIHRDLKPANIMFGREGEVKIGDFGLVTNENEDDAEERTVYKGTPSYMAPEQKSKSPTLYDRKVDIFAFGLICFELLCNIPAGQERTTIWEDARNQKLPQGFSLHFHQESQIIRSMLSMKPEDRPEASKLKIELEECKRSFMLLKNMQRESKTV